jgi:hypothetical protein
MIQHPPLSMLMLVIISIFPYRSFQIVFKSSWTPSTLSPADPLITALSPAPNNLRARAIDTCAFISGDIASPMTCGSGFTCSSAGLGFFHMACCNGVTCTDDARTCIPHLGTACADTAICSEVYTTVLYCSQAAPACVTYQRIDSVGAADGLTSYACGATATQIIALITPTNAGSGDTLPTSTFEGGISGSPSGSITFAISATASTATEFSSPSASTTSNDGGGDGLTKNNKITIGITIAGTLLVALGVWYARQANIIAKGKSEKSENTKLTRLPPGRSLGS